MFVAAFLPTSAGESPGGQSVKALGCVAVWAKHWQIVNLASAKTISV
jgi:hypothetical protein